jgi:hypothetical protein
MAKVDESGKGKFGQAPGAAFPFMAPFNFEQFMDLNRPALTAIAEINGKAYENISTLNKTWVSFLNRRLKEDLAVPQQLAGCKTVHDMVGVYRGFVENAVADYQAEFEALSKLGKSISEETATVLQARFEEAVPKARTGTRG